MFPLQRGPWQGRKSAFVRLQLGAKRARFAGQAWTWPCWVVPGGKCHIDRRPGFCPGPGEISLGRLPGVCGVGWAQWRHAHTTSLLHPRSALSWAKASQTVGQDL